MQFAKLNEIYQHYQVIGAPPEKPTIVFANSLGTDFRIWRDVIVRLVGDFGLVTYDMRGHGLSDVGERPFSIDLLAADLIALLDHLSAKNVILCGLSVGGLVAQAVAAKRQDLVAALVLCDTGHKIGPPEVWDMRIALAKQGGMAAMASVVEDRWLTKDYVAREPDMVAGYRNMVTRQPLAGYIGTCEAIRDADLSESSSTLPMPVSCIVGADDVVTPPALVAELAKLVPDGRYDEIADCGHMPCIEQPILLTEIIKAFAGDALPAGTDRFGKH